MKVTCGAGIAERPYVSLLSHLSSNAELGEVIFTLVEYIKKNNNNNKIYVFTYLITFLDSRERKKKGETKSRFIFLSFSAKVNLTLDKGLKRETPR